MGIAEIAAAKAAKLRAEKGEKPAVKNSPKKEDKNMAHRSAKKATKKAAKGSTKHSADVSKLRDKVNAMRKQGKGFGEIAKQLKISDSYAWVLHHNYKYQG